MTFGTIKINGSIAAIYINKTDVEVKEIFESMKLQFQNLNVDITWNNSCTDKSFYELEEFLGITNY